MWHVCVQQLQQCLSWLAVLAETVDSASSRRCDQPTSASAGSWSRTLCRRWLQQLSTMDLPASVMREAYDEAPLMIDHKARMRECFDWNNV